MIKMAIGKKIIIYSILSSAAAVLIIYILFINYLHNEMESEPFDASKHHSDYIEKKIGMSCGDFYELVIRFIDEELKAIIEAGEKGEDWLALVSDSNLEKIDLHEKNAFDCMIAKKVEKNNKENNKYKPIREMLSALEAFSRASSEQSRTSRNVKPEAFELIKEPYYRILSQRRVSR